MKRYDTTGSKTLEDLDPNSSYARAYALIPPGSRVLDLGCGSGELASYLAARGDRVWGVDINPAALAQAAASCVQTRLADLEESDVSDLFPGQRFDVVVLADVLEHVREPWNVLQSARNVLDAGGRVVASIPNFAHAAVRLAVVSGEIPYRGLGILDGTHVRFFTLGGVTSLFEESGFRVQVIERTTLPFEQPSGLIPDVRVLRVPDHIERHVREDPENETLQFVVRAVMLPGEWNMDALRDRLHDVEAHASEQAIGIRNLERDIAGALGLADERAAQVSALEVALQTARADLFAAAAERDEAGVARSREAAAKHALEVELAARKTALSEAIEERDERAAQVSALEVALQTAHADLLAAAAERDEAAVARSREAAAKHALEIDFAARQTALSEAIDQRDVARAAGAEAQAQIRRLETEFRHELKGTHREVAELRDALEAARGQLAAADADRMAVVAELRHALETARGQLAAADADRTAVERACADARREQLTATAQRDERAAAARAADETFARYRAEATAAQDALRDLLRATANELEQLKKRDRYEALAWIAREHEAQGAQEDGAQFWCNGLATR